MDIQWDKIFPAYKRNFDKYGSDMISDFATGYDYGSVHYPSIAFAIDDKSPTIIPKKDLKNVVMGHRERLSEKDIKKLKRMCCEATYASAFEGWAYPLLKSIFG